MRGAVLFDLDNTLTPRQACVERFAEIVLRDFASRLAEGTRAGELAPLLVACDEGGYNPRRAEALCERLPWRDAPGAAELEAHWQRRFPDAIVPEPGLLAVLADLDATGFRLGVVTNGPVRGQNAKIDGLGIRGRLRAVVTSEGAGCEKPDPGIFERACREVGIAAPDCWFVGDHPEKDVLAAEAVGMRGVWMTRAVGGHTWPADHAPPRFAIESLCELPALLGASASEREGLLARR